MSIGFGRSRQYAYNVELLLDSHDDLNGVEGIQTEVSGESGSGSDLLSKNTQRLNQGVKDVSICSDLSTGAVSPHA